MTTVSSSGELSGSTGAAETSAATTADATEGASTSTGAPDSSSGSSTGEPGACDQFDCAPGPNWSVGFGDGEILNEGLVVDAAGNIYLGGIYKLGISHAQHDVEGSSTIFKMHVMKFAPDGSLQWISDLGDGKEGGGHETLRDLIVTESGSLFITGDYTGPLFLCEVDLGGESTDPDLFVAQLDANNGQCGKVVAFPTNGTQFGSGLAYDASFDRLILGGGYQGQLDLGVGPLESEGFAFGQATGFIAGLDSSLQVHWAQQLGGLGGYEAVNTVINGSPGSVLIAGTFANSIVLGSDEHTSAGPRDSFVARLAVADGAFSWSDSFVSDGETSVRGLAYDGDDEMVVVGDFTSTISALELDSGSDVNHDIFLVNMNATTGDVSWAQRFGAPAVDDIARGVAVDAEHGHVFVSGPCFEGLDLGGGPLVISGPDDACLARYELATGAHLWSERFGGSSNKQPESGRQLAFDGESDPVALLWAGDYYGTMEIAGPALVADGELARTFLARLLP